MFHNQSPRHFGTNSIYCGSHLVSFSHVKRIYNFESITFAVGGPIKYLMVEENRGGSTPTDL